MKKNKKIITLCRYCEMNSAAAASPKGRKEGVSRVLQGVSRMPPLAC